MRSESKVAIVTGASSGLGFLIATRLQQLGYRVIACSRHRPQKATFQWNKVDVADERQVRKFIKNIVREKGRIDVLINNAGYASRLESINDASDKDLLGYFQTNVYGPFYLMREVIPLMEKQGEGKIINIASKTAIYANPMLALYSASKSALLTLTQAVAKEFRNKKTKVACFVVSPGGMNTKMRARLYGKDTLNQQMNPKLVAGVVAELAFRGTVPKSVPENRKTSHMNVPHGANILVKRGIVSIKAMEDG